MDDRNPHGRSHLDDRNPHGLCTWNDQSGCAGCVEKDVLNCRYDRGKARFFQVNQVPSLAVALGGLALAGYVTGAWWMLAAFVLATIIFWGLGLETLLLCRHCPYYGESGKKLRCLALDGWPKLWRYRPGPMSLWEKAVLSGFVAFATIFPLAGEAYGLWSMYADQARFGPYALAGMAVVLVATALTTVQFYYIVSVQYCSRCVNFSCPMNTVPKPTRDAYLKRNPVMGGAWEERGYKFR